MASPARPSHAVEATVQSPPRPSPALQTHGANESSVDTIELNMPTCAHPSALQTHGANKSSVDADESSIPSSPRPLALPKQIENDSSLAMELNIPSSPRACALDNNSARESLLSKAAIYHSRVPYLRRLPLPAIRIIVIIALVNCLVWAAVGIILHSQTTVLISTATLSYTLGLRHALDADHISAIDLMTRRLIADGQRPVTVGMFFSLGHSTIVIITSVVVAATAAAISSEFSEYSRVGGIIGTSVSASFLIILGIMNVYILYKLVQTLRAVLRRPPNAEGDEPTEFKIEGGGLLFRVFKKLFKLIDRPWKMYPLGVMFGLGFDTSSEIALLGIASIQGAEGTSIWLIMIYPVLFTAGMCLLDTTDGALMMSLYTSTSFARDTIAILYYSVVLTFITIVVAVCIGTIQLLTLVVNVASPPLTGPFWDGVNTVGDHYDVIGGAICGSFVLFGSLSVLLYGPWRRRVVDSRNSPAR